MFCAARLLDGPATPVDIRLSAHAVERYIERAKPFLSLDAGAYELAHLVTLGCIVRLAPTWFASRQRQVAPMYLVVGDIALPLDPDPSRVDRLLARTCLVPDATSYAAQIARSKRRSRRGDRCRDRRGPAPYDRPSAVAAREELACEPTVFEGMGRQG